MRALLAPTPTTPQPTASVGGYLAGRNPREVEQIRQETRRVERKVVRRKMIPAPSNTGSEAPRETPAAPKLIEVPKIEVPKVPQIPKVEVPKVPPL